MVLTATEPIADDDMSRPGAVRRLIDVAGRHPVLTVAVAAFLVRAVVAAVIVLMDDGVLIPDEMQYIELATASADGRGAAGWSPIYGPALYSATSTFLIPLTALFKVLGAWRFWGQLLAAAGGAATAAMVTHLAGGFVRRNIAVIAGLLVALWPSQVLWSSVVLRESMVWATLAAIAVGLVTAAHARDDRVLTAGVAAVGLSLWGLSHLRVQSFVATAWAVALAVPLLRGRRRLVRTLAIWLLVLVVPLETGQGLGSYTMLERALPALGRTRVASSTNAQSAFIKPVDQVEPSGAASGVAPSTSTTLPVLNTPGLDLSEPTLVVSGDGTVYLVQETAGANARYLPKGLVAILGRPFPWEATNDIDLAMARAENALWFALYALAIAGAWWHRRRWRELAFPIACGAGVLAVAALVQGNLGTAFRHRAQVLWILALLAGLALERIADRRAARRTTLSAS